MGAVISVLWLIGLPTYLVVHSSMNANHLYDECMKSFADLTREEQHETCLTSSHLGAVTPRIIGHALIAGNSDTAALWTMMLGPVVLPTAHNPFLLTNHNYQDHHNNCSGDK